MEYKHERFRLNKYCEFKNREVESEFMEYEKTASLNILRFLILVMGFTFAIFAVSDFINHRDSNNIITILALRAAGLAIALSAFFIAGRFKRYDNTLLMITIAELAIFGIYLLTLFHQKTSDPALQFMSVMLHILTIFLIPNRWKNCMITGCIILLSYIIFCSIFYSHVQSPSLLQRALYLFICLFSCAIFIYGKESLERKHFAAEQLLIFMSITDGLTGIYNRRRFEQILSSWIRSKRHDPFCLVLYDIDDFKIVNDSLGHNAGDEVLISTARVISANIRDDDIFARWGGEEFVILFSRVDIARATELAERLRKAVEETPSGESGKITISIGVSQYKRGEAGEQSEDQTIDDLIKRADEKMYEAKRSGKNFVVADI